MEKHEKEEAEYQRRLKEAAEIRAREAEERKQKESNAWEELLDSVVDEVQNSMFSQFKWCA